MKTIILFINIVLIGVSLSAQVPCATAGDDDGDGLCNDIDPCPTVFNPNPVDSDGDGIFNACDSCPDVANADQADIDNDGIGDACDPCVDPDGDGVCGSRDRCPGGDDNIDIDNDNIPDDCDDCIDVDRDDICDDVDDCINTNAGASCDDGDECTTGDTLDEFCNCIGTLIDSDGDGVCDRDDKCPGSDDNLDYDGDGVPDGCDEDANCSSCEADENGRITICHIFPNGRAQSINGDCNQLGQYFTQSGGFVSGEDHCGPCTCADEGDVDSDGDGICDKKDPCPNDATDSDGDGVCDSMDVCPGSDDMADSDADGIPDGCDEKEYCVPDYSSELEWIESIMINGESFTNGQSSSLTLYGSGLQLEKGGDYQIEVTTEHVDDICELSTKIYIDSNDDGDFADSGEEIYSGRGLSKSEMMMSVEGLEPGIYRMRVIVHYGRISSACQSNIDGEVEDVLIEVIAQQPCSEIAEPFAYSTNQSLEEVDFNEGWAGPWEVVSSSGDQVVILEDEGESNKLGVLNSGGSMIEISRDVDIDLGGSSDLYYSMKLERISGVGSVAMELGGVNFGVNENGMFYLENEVGSELVEDEEYMLQLHIAVTNGGGQNTTFTVATASGETTELTTSVNVEEVISNYKIVTNSTDSFLPMAHYIDEIRISCTEMEMGEFQSTTSKGRRHKIQHEGLSEDLSMQLWPNPSNGVNPSVIVTGKKDLYNYEIVDVSGKIVTSGTFFKGYNRINATESLAGIYFIKVTDGRSVITQRVVK